MRNRFIRIVAIVLAVMLALSIAMPIFSLLGRAQTPVVATDIYPIHVSRGGLPAESIAPGRSYRIEFDARVNLGIGVTPPDIPVSSAFNVNPAWSRPSGATLTLEFGDETSTPGVWPVSVTISQLTYVSNQRVDRLWVTGVRVETTRGERQLIFDMNIPIYFEGGNWEGGNGPGNNNNNNDNGLSNNGPERDPEYIFESSIVVESVTAHDAAGNIISEITRDTPPFSLQITFTDHGLVGVPRNLISASALAAFLTDTDRFIPHGSVRGTMRSLPTHVGDAPRFLATFTNLTYAGGADLFVEVGFRAQYSIRAQRHFGDGTARFFGISREDDEDGPDPFTPHIILSSHSFGGEPVPAGNVFTLSMDFVNTSNDIDLHNILMVVSPVSTEQQQSFLTIASDTNTYFVGSMPAGSSRSQSIDILVMAAAPAGSQAVSVAFEFEYMVGSDLHSNSLSTIIHIPITQVDRFTVSPITDLSEWMQLGDEGYVVVSFVNMGQATTFNIRGYIYDAQGDPIGGAEHYGNLEAGASGSLDFTFSPFETGEHTGTIVIRYENEVGEEMSIEQSFTVFVDEPWRPDPGFGWEDPGMFEPEPTGIAWWRYVLIVLGGLGIATPLALYIIKRVKVKGEGEVLDEDF